MSILAYTKHEGGREEQEAVQQLVAELSTTYWVSSQVQLLNRPLAPTMIAIFRRQDRPIPRKGMPGHEDALAAVHASRRRTSRHTPDSGQVTPSATNATS